MSIVIDKTVYKWLKLFFLFMFLGIFLLWTCVTSKFKLIPPLQLFLTVFIFSINPLTEIYLLEKIRQCVGKIIVRIIIYLIIFLMFAIFCLSYYPIDILNLWYDGSFLYDGERYYIERIGFHHFWYEIYTRNGLFTVRKMERDEIVNVFKKLYAINDEDIIFKIKSIIDDPYY